MLRTADRYGIPPDRVLLDKSIHYNAMASLPQKWKRGRPDIVHTTLLVVTESPLFAAGLIEVYIHVYDGRVFRLDNRVRLPKNYERFKGLMAQLLREGRVPPEGDPLIYEAYDSLRGLVKDYGGLILLWEKGNPATPEYVVSRGLATGMPLGIGAFPKGDFKRSTLRKSREKYSILGGISLKTWGVAGRVVYAFERIYNARWSPTSWEGPT